MKYEDMSDGELSWKVWHAIKKIPEGYATICVLDINNPSDIMPIAIEHGIGNTPSGEKWMANNFNPSEIGDYQVQIFAYDKNPYRAIAICFLKMMDAKNA